MKQETKLKISKKMKGRIFTEEHRKNLSLKGKGIKKKRESIEKMIKTKTGKTYNNIYGEEKAREIREKLSYLNKGNKNNMFGKTHSTEARKKISEARKNLKGKIHKNKKTGKYINCKNCGKDKYIFLSVIKNNKDRKFFCCLDCKIDYFRKNKEYFLMKNRKDIVCPKKDTSIEIKIQNFLKELSIEFFTHQYINIKNGYQCDIFIPSKNMIIECDGDYWHNFPNGNNIDHIRTKELLQNGFKVLRLWENEIRDMNINKFKKRMEELD